MLNSKEYTIEVKTDKFETPNIFFETVSNIEKKTIGCMYKTKADYIFYYFLAFKELYMLKRKEYVEWADKNKLYLPGCKYREPENFVYDKETGFATSYTSAGYIIPKKYIIEESFCKVIKNFE